MGLQNRHHLPTGTTTV